MQTRAFAPGEHGGEALADLLTGRANFSARLPLSVPKSAGAVPYTYNHRLKSAGTPVAYHFGCRYPFGFGLSYTQFRYSGLAVARWEVPIGDGTVELSFMLENVGAREGTEVVQIYVRDLLASSARPVRELKGFARVPLAARESAQVRVRIPVDMLNFTDGREERIVEPGDFELMVGSSSRDIHLSDTVSVTGQAVRTLERDWRMVSEVEVVS
ncbi:fibronectin type III-like domain-contianing protein [Paraburkholderia sp. DGU8]|uniref:fibronectin type III-like domain-contianing protein n=1 Tax=Paraburkholderia sp. DGU8 TaxID=3161997 RepID=UPI0034654B2E